MADNDDQQNTPLQPPPKTDPDWRQKIETAQRAREQGEELRAGKGSSFRRSVGRAAS